MRNIGVLAFFLLCLFNQGRGQQLCNVCINVMDQAIDDLIQIIANGGVIGTCGALCGQLNNSVAQTICDLVCDYEGITEFVKLLQEADPDPVWFCMIGEACPINDNVKGTVGWVKVSPTTGAQGATFTLSANYTVQTTTGNTGTLDVLFEVLPPSAQDEPFGFDNVGSYGTPGTYMVNTNFQATPQEGESFGPGTYQVIFAVCEGTCGCIHDHCYTITQARSFFTIK